MKKHKINVKKSQNKYSKRKIEEFGLFLKFLSLFGNS